MMVITSKCCKYGALLHLIITSFLVQLRCDYFYCVVFLSMARKTLTCSLKILNSLFICGIMIMNDNWKQ